jgi:hypothetical protein
MHVFSIMVPKMESTVGTDLVPAIGTPASPAACRVAGDVAALTGPAIPGATATAVIKKLGHRLL